MSHKSFENKCLEKRTKLLESLWQSPGDEDAQSWLRWGTIPPWEQNVVGGPHWNDADPLKIPGYGTDHPQPGVSLMINEQEDSSPLAQGGRRNQPPGRRWRQKWQRVSRAIAACSLRKCEGIKLEPGPWLLVCIMGFCKWLHELFCVLHFKQEFVYLLT